MDFPRRGATHESISEGRRASPPVVSRLVWDEIFSVNLLRAVSRGLKEIKISEARLEYTLACPDAENTSGPNSALPISRRRLAAPDRCVTTVKLRERREPYDKSKAVRSPRAATNNTVLCRVH